VGTEAISREGIPARGRTEVELELAYSLSTMQQRERSKTAMCSRSYSAVVVAVFALLSSAVSGQVGPPKDFKFTQADEKLFNEAEAIDRQFEKRGLLFNDPALDAHLEEVAKPIVASAGTPDRVRWIFRILRDPSVNAFAMPNGSIYVHTGLLALLESDAQLAGILAREIAHGTNRDAYRQFRAYRNKAFGRNVAEATALAGSVFPAPNLALGTGTYWGALIEVVGGASEVAMATSLFGYSGELEREADTFAVNQMTAEGYDPMELPKALRLLDEKLEVELVTTFYSDHQKLAQRIAYTTSIAKGKQSPSAPTPISDPPYAAIVERAVRYNIQADIDSRRFRMAVAHAQHLVDLHPADPEDTFLLAEAYRALGPRTAEPSDKNLTRRGKAHARMELMRRTPEEEENELLSRPDGRRSRQANQEKAEELYVKVQAMNTSYANVYRGLGLLYEDQGKWKEAQAAYGKYLELAPDASEGLRIRRRLDALDKALKESGHP